MSFDCIILAAGLSSRMGRWKPVMELDGKSLIRRSVENAQVNCNGIIIVGGYRFTELKEHLKNYPGITIAENRNYKSGMLSSIKEGLPFVKTDKFFVTLGDMPFIKPEIYSLMSREMDCDVLFPNYDGRKGHPVLINGSLKSKIREASDSMRMRDILMREKYSMIEIDDPGIITDFDRPSDLVDN